MLRLSLEADRVERGDLVLRQGLRVNWIGPSESKPSSSSSTFIGLTRTEAADTIQWATRSLLTAALPTAAQDTRS